MSKRVCPNCKRTVEAMKLSGWAAQYYRKFSCLCGWQIVIPLFDPATNFGSPTARGEHA